MHKNDSDIRFRWLADVGTRKDVADVSVYKGGNGIWPARKMEQGCNMVTRLPPLESLQHGVSMLCKFLRIISTNIYTLGKRTDPTTLERGLLYLFPSHYHFLTLSNEWFSINFLIA